MSGKGSKARPFSVSKKQFDENFEKIFGKKETKKEEGEYEILPDVCEAPIEFVKVSDEPLNIKEDR